LLSHAGEPYTLLYCFNNSRGKIPDIGYLFAKKEIMENRQQRRLDRQEEYARRLLHRRYSSSLLWMWIGVSVLVILLLLWLTIFEFWQA